MHYRALGHTGIKISALGFGCMRLPTLGAPDRIDETAATKLLHDAIDAGVNYIDTAWFYHSAVSMAAGESEPFVGRALSGEWRERIHLATKLPQQLVKAREDMDGFLARQLERLRTDHIDFYLVHGLNGESWNRMRDLGVRDFLDKARERGLIRHTAFSFHGKKEDFPRIIDEYDGWAFGQLQYNYVDTDYQAGLSGLRYSAGKGLGVVVMEPLKGGRLANKIPAEMQAIFDKRSEGWSPAGWTDRRKAGCIRRRPSRDAIADESRLQRLPLLPTLSPRRGNPRIPGGAQRRFDMGYQRPLAYRLWPDNRQARSVHRVRPLRGLVSPGAPDTEASEGNGCCLREPVALAFTRILTGSKCAPTTGHSPQIGS